MDISLKSIAHILGGDLRGNQVLAPGPGHSREDRSLSITTNDSGDDIVVHSFAHDDPVVCKKYVRDKCGIQFKPNGKQRFSEDDITRAVMAAVEAKAPRSKPVATYPYADADGELLYEVLRFEPKRFQHRHPDGHGGWVYKGTQKRVLYRLPELIAFPDATVFICEGEKDADNVAALDLCATTIASGKWTDDCVNALAGRDCCILEDNDDAGRKKALEAATLLHPVTNSIKIIRLHGLGEGGDVTDWLDAGHTKDELEDVCYSTPDWEPESLSSSSTLRSDSPSSSHMVGKPNQPTRSPDRKPNRKTAGTISPSSERSIVAIRANTLKPESITWAWKDRFAFGKLAMIAGDPGLGKSTVLIEIAALHSRGGEFPCGEGRAVQCEVSFLTAEDGLRDTLVPRLIAAEADLSKVHFLTGTKADDATGNEPAMFDMSRDIAALRKFLRDNSAVKILIIDPLTAYLGSGTKAKENTDVRRVLTPLVKLAEEFGVLVLANNHLNKSGGKALYRILDSIAFVALGRIIHLVIADANTLEIKKLICEKTGIGSQPAGLTYFIQKTWIRGEDGEQIETSRIVWGTTTIDETADEALGTGDDTPTMGEEAEKLLREVLADGRMVVQDIEAEAKAAGMLGATKEIRASKPFRTACERLGVIHERDGFGPGAKYYWRLP